MVRAVTMVHTFITVLRQKWRLCLSVTSFSGPTSEARGLKIGMQISHMDGFKFTNQICLAAEI